MIYCLTWRGIVLPHYISNSLGLLVDDINNHLGLSIDEMEDFEYGIVTVDIHILEKISIDLVKKEMMEG